MEEAEMGETVDLRVPIDISVKHVVAVVVATVVLIFVLELAGIKAIMEVAPWETSEHANQARYELMQKIEKTEETETHQAELLVQVSANNAETVKRLENLSETVAKLQQKNEDTEAFRKQTFELRKRQHESDWSAWHERNERKAEERALIKGNL